VADVDELTKAVLDCAYEEDGRKKLNCAQIFKLASQRGVKLMDIARICNAQGIRISNCQLGCFK